MPGHMGPSTFKPAKTCQIPCSELMTSYSATSQSKLYFYRDLMIRLGPTRLSPFLNCVVWNSLITGVKLIIFTVLGAVQGVYTRKGDGFGSQLNMLPNQETCSHPTLNNHLPPDSEQTQSPAVTSLGICVKLFLNGAAKCAFSTICLACSSLR